MLKVTTRASDSNRTIDSRMVEITSEPFGMSMSVSVAVSSKSLFISEVYAIFGGRRRSSTTGGRERVDLTISERLLVVAQIGVGRRIFNVRAPTEEARPLIHPSALWSETKKHTVNKNTWPKVL